MAAPFGVVGAGGIDAGLILAPGCDKAPRDAHGWAGLQTRGASKVEAEGRGRGQVAGAGGPWSLVMPVRMSPAHLDRSLRCRTVRLALRAMVAGMLNSR